MAIANETCANCGETIGRLETPHVYEGHVVCGACVSKLSRRELRADSSGEVIQRAPLRNLCPGCNAPDTARLSVIHEAGTKRASFSGVALGDISEGMIGHGLIQSVQAQNAAPPEKRRAFIWAAGAFAIAVFLVNAAGGALVMWGGGLLILFLGAKAYRTNSRWNEFEWPNQYKMWASKWICRRCGRIFIPPR